ncbi:MAG TPA: penicillin-binding transpeptidase domain-containing protein, partial [Pyrinomonadaceae bacterium]|nr:penicillin-binding transpeptidase domain-containing protein [Pyrinomonadaceae bacterium]
MSHRRPAFFALILSLCFALACESNPGMVHRAGRAAGEAEIDEALSRAAIGALGEREGAVIVLDPQTGRVRALVNPRLAFEQAFPPGSTVKPFTALAALRAGLLDADSRTLCRKHYTSGPFTIACSHPKSDASFNLVQALAYSCNYYFATMSERLNESAWNATLTSFGFGEPTGINSPGESAGKLERGGEWGPQVSLGEGDHLLVTPIQLLTAYSALVNGGRLLRPQLGAAGAV